MDFLQKPVTYSKSLVQLSKVSIYTILPKVLGHPFYWLIYILFISESQDSLAQFMENLQKV